MDTKQSLMVVKIRFGRGPVVTRRKGKNGRAALLFASLLTLTSVCLASLGIWRLCEDLDLAGQFFFRDGLLSHWQVWIGAAAVLQYARWRLTRYARGAQRDDDSAEAMGAALAASQEPNRAAKRAAANV